MKKTYHSNSQLGFTLIELLVVVAIIGILASIAVVNLQSAQARSKVARVQADMRTISGALELYRLDLESYPPAAPFEAMLLEPLAPLTTPQAYLSALPEDPFGEAPFDFNSAITLTGYHYVDRLTTSVGIPAETYGDMWQALPGRQYLVHSPGPNRVWNVSPYVPYDPTNGTISTGDISVFGP